MIQILAVATDLGNLAVLVPLALAMAVWLIRYQPRGAALAWLGALFVCGLVSALSKIVFYACPPIENLVSPSGHTSMSLVVYGGLGAICASQTGARWRAIPVAAVVGLVATIALSRVVLHFHSETEILVGSIIGVASLTVFLIPYLRS